MYFNGTFHCNLTMKLIVDLRENSNCVKYSNLLRGNNDQ